MDEKHDTPAIDMSPVDYVAKSIVHVVLKVGCGSSGGGSNFNVVNPKPYPYTALFRRVQEFGFDMEAVGYSVWRQRLLEGVESGEQKDNALMPILSHFSPGWSSGLKNPVYDMRQLKAQLADSKPKIACPALDSLVFTYLTYLVRCGYLSAPPTVKSKLVNQADWDIIGKGATKMTMLSRTNRS